MARALYVMVAGLVVFGLGLLLAPSESAADPASKQMSSDVDRSPVDLVLTPDQQFLITVNQTASTVALVHTASGAILAEVPCGERPSAIALVPNGKQVLVSGTFGGDLRRYDLKDGKLVAAGAVYLGFEPRGVAVSADGKWAYVALTAASAVAVVDLEKFRAVARIDVGRWPRYLALSPDGSRLAVGLGGDGGVAVVDTAAGKQLFIEDFMALNLGQMQVSGDGRQVYVPWMVYRHNPITPQNVRQGWVLASRIARVRLDKQARREAIALDPQGQAVADPHGLALSPDEEWLVCAASGSQELLIYRLAGLPFQDYGGPGDHIDPQLLKDPERFFRIRLGGRPMAVRFSRDGKRVFVSNYLLNAVQVVELAQRKLVRTIALGGPRIPSPERRGEALFFDGTRSLDQWFSCHSCHYEGHTNSVTMDTRADGRFGNFKKVPSLRNVTRTGPWTWHGWADNLEGLVRKSFVESMLGKEPAVDELKALVAYLDTLRPPSSPYRRADGSLTDAARRGEALFLGSKAGCSSCHPAPYFTDGRIRRVGTEEPGDVYKGYNPPSLIGAYDRVQYLHDGRAKSLRELLTGPHAPEKVTNNGKLTPQELDDLIEYVKSL